MGLNADDYDLEEPSWVDETMIVPEDVSDTEDSPPSRILSNVSPLKLQASSRPVKPRSNVVMEVVIPTPRKSQAPRRNENHQPDRESASTPAADTAIGTIRTAW
jgi:hypothetical protein